MHSSYYPDQSRIDIHLSEEEFRFLHDAINVFIARWALRKSLGWPNTPVIYAKCAEMAQHFQERMNDFEAQNTLTDAPQQQTRAL